MWLVGWLGHGQKGDTLNEVVMPDLSWYTIEEECQRLREIRMIE